MVFKGFVILHAIKCQWGYAMICMSDIFRFVWEIFWDILINEQKKSLLVCLTEYSNGVVIPKSNTRSMLRNIFFKGQNLLFCKDAADDINARKWCNLSRVVANLMNRLWLDRAKDLQLMLPFSTPPSDVTTSNNKKRWKKTLWTAHAHVAFHAEASSKTP